MNALLVWAKLYPSGIPPAEFQFALALAELATQAEKNGSAVKLPEQSEYRAVVDAQPVIRRATPHKRTSMRVDETAKEAKVTRQAVYAAIKRKALKARKVKGEYRIRWADAQACFVK